MLQKTIFCSIILAKYIIFLIVLTFSYNQLAAQKSRFETSLSPIVIFSELEGNGYGMNLSYVRKLGLLNYRVDVSISHARGFDFTHDISDIVSVNTSDLVAESAFVNDTLERFYNEFNNKQSQIISYTETGLDSKQNINIGLLTGYAFNIFDQIQLEPSIGVKLGKMGFTKTTSKTVITNQSGKFEDLFYQLHGEYFYWGLCARLDLRYLINDKMYLGGGLSVDTHKYYVNDIGEKIVSMNFTFGVNIN